MISAFCCELIHLQHTCKREAPRHIAGLRGLPLAVAMVQKRLFLELDFRGGNAQVECQAGSFLLQAYHDALVVLKAGSIGPLAHRCAHGDGRVIAFEILQLVQRADFPGGTGLG